MKVSIPGLSASKVTVLLRMYAYETFQAELSQSFHLNCSGLVAVLQSSSKENQVLIFLISSWAPSVLTFCRLQVLGELLAIGLFPKLCTYAMC